MKKTTLAIAALSLALTSYGQRYMGIATSNWSGMNSLYLNPANAADNRAGFALDLISLNVGADNDLVKLDAKSLGQFSLAGLGSYADLSGQHINMAIHAGFNMPGVMLGVKKNSFAIGTRVRVMAQANNFDQRIFNMINDPATNPSAPVSLTARDFNFTLNAWSEVRFTYAREVYNEGDHFLKAGVTLTRLGGIGFMGIKGSVEGTYDPGNVSLTAKQTDVTFATSFYNSASQLTGGTGDGASSFFGKKFGNGWGGDLGLVYEYRPDGGGADAGNASANKYKVRGSIALTDMGSIKYDASSARLKANGVMKASDLSDSMGNYANFESYARNQGFTLDTGGHVTTKVKMPTALVIGADYYVASHFYVNATYVMNMVNRNANFGNSIYNQITITPRWDTKIFSVGVPIGINAISGFKAGLGVRLAGIMFGSDDLFGLVGSAKGANAYFGAYVPIYKKNKNKNNVTNAPELKPAEAPAPVAPKN